MAYTREQLIQIAYDAAIQAGIDPNIYIAQINQESGFQEGLTSSAGASGIAQFMPETAAGLGIDPNDPVAALYGGAQLMAQLLDRYNGNYAAALAAYNAGPGTVDAVLQGQAELPPETGQYLDAILAGGSVGPGAIQGSTAMGDPLGGGGATVTLPSSVQVQYNGNGEAYRYDPLSQTFIRTPELDDPAHAATFQSQSDLAAIATQLRGQNITAANNAAQIGLGYANLGQNYASLAEQQRQFNETQAFAKEKWLFEQQNTIAQLQLQQQELATTQAQNARQYSLELQNQQFLQNQFAFQSGMALRQEARETQSALFAQQATVAGIQMDMVSITQQAKNLQAQLNQEVALFNAGKAADVSMFNIDQQTKAAMFNAEGAFNAATFNEQMKFNVTQANKQEERYLRDEQMKVAQLISEAAADPGDRGKLASLIQALSGAGFGGMDAALANTDLRTADSTAPLESFLRTREQIQAADKTPFDFTPVSFTPVTAGQASFTPAGTTSVPMPNFSGVQIPQPNITPFDPNSIPMTAPNVSPMSYDSTKQQFIANGTTSAPGETLNINGTPLTAEQRAQIPDFALQSMINSGVIPKMAQGGDTQGAYIGDERGQELHMPFFGPGGQRNQLVLPHNQTQRLMNGMPNSTPSIQPAQPPAQPNFQMPNWGGDGQIFGMPARDVMMNGYRNPNWNPAQTSPYDYQNFVDGFSVGGRKHQPPTEGAPPAQPLNQPQFSPEILQFLQRIGHPLANIPHMDNGGVVEGPYLGNDNGDAMHIPIPGTDMTIIMPKPKDKKAKKKAQGMEHMAAGGIFDNADRSIFEGLVDDTDRQRAMDFLAKAGQRATAQTPFDINRLPTPVFASSPGQSRFLTDLLGSLNALRRGIPLEYFREQANLLKPAGYTEGVVGRTG